MDELALLRDFARVEAIPDEARARARAAIDAALAARRRRRRLVAAAAFVAAAAVAGTAYAVVRQLVVGDPAPPEVRSQPARFSHSAELIPVPHPDEPQLQHARVAAVLESSVGRVYLFSSQNARGSCLSTWIEGDRGFQGRLNMTSVCGPPTRSYYAFGEQRFRGRSLVLVAGHAGNGVTRVTVLVGGRDLAIPLTGRAFLAETRQMPERFTSYRADGTIVEQRAVIRPHPPAHVVRPPHQVSRSRRFAQLTTEGGERLSLFVARASDGGFCQIIRSNRRMSNRGCSIKHPAADATGVAAMNFGGAPGGVLLLVGPVGSRVRSLVLHYQDGRSREIPIHDGWVLSEVAAANYRNGRRPASLTAADARGHVTSTEHFPWASG